MQVLLATLREEFEDKLKDIQNLIPREIAFETVLNKILVFIGMRRTGKTTFLFQQILSLINEGINPTRILYVNFEDDRLLANDTKILVGLVDAFFTLFPANYDTECYLFFDEIQNVPNWQRVIRRFQDTKKVVIYLTGSSAKLLSKEIASSLRGRSIATEVWPFSYSEYLTANQISPPPKVMGKKNYDQYYQNLKHYLESGGFPETTLISKSRERSLLQDYVDLVIMRDIIERYQITNHTLIRYMIKTLLKNVGSPFSVNKFFNDIKSQGLSASKNTLYDYLQHIEDAFLVFMVPFFSESVRKVASNPKKTYVIDTGLINAYTVSLSPQYGHLFENVIYLDLRRQNHKVFYYRTQEDYEIDFVSRDPQGKLHLWQVCWDIEDKKTLEREQRALEAAEKELGIKGQLITPQSYLSGALIK